MQSSKGSFKPRNPKQRHPGERGAGGRDGGGFGRQERSGSGERRPPREGGSHGFRPKAARPEVTVKGRSDRLWLYGWHSVTAALANPARQCFRFWATEGGLEALNARPELAAKARTLNVQKVSGQEFQSILPPDAPHQGLALEVAPLPSSGLEDILHSARKGPVLLLDQVTDPHNVGAMLRSALAFGARGVITTERHSAQETGAMARASAGALERMPLVRVPNLVNAMLALKSAGYWVVGLDAQGKETVHRLKLGKKVALVLGSEGKGLRRLTAERCDVLARLPMGGEMESLNVSNAAAIALFSCFIQQEN